MIENGLPFCNPVCKVICLKVSLSSLHINVARYTIEKMYVKLR